MNRVLALLMIRALSPYAVFSHACMHAGISSASYHLEQGLPFSNPFVWHFSLHHPLQPSQFGFGSQTVLDRNRETFERHLSPCRSYAKKTQEEALGARNNSLQPAARVEAMSTPRQRISSSSKKEAPMCHFAFETTFAELHGNGGSACVDGNTALASCMSIARITSFYGGQSAQNGARGSRGAMFDMLPPLTK